MTPVAEHLSLAEASLFCTTLFTSALKKWDAESSSQVGLIQSTPKFLGDPEKIESPTTIHWAPNSENPKVDRIYFLDPPRGLWASEFPNLFTAFINRKSKAWALLVMGT